MPARSYSVHEILRILARHRWLVLVPLALGAAAAPLLARYAPKRFRSEALILVIPQQVPDAFVKPTVTESVAQRLPAITDQILSRSRLERIIQDMDLYKAERAREVMENIVQTMRGDITTTAAGKEVDSFRVSYVSDTAVVAQKVTERLTSLYIEQNLQDRASQSENTSQFLATQLDDAKRRLIEQEKKLEAYRKAHAGQLPSQLLGNLQAIQNANLQLQALSESSNRAMERRLLIERQIADAQVAPLPQAPPAAPGAEAPPPSSTAQLLEMARGRRTALLLRFTPDHPDVVSAEKTIAELTARVESETPLGATPAVTEPPLSPAEAAQRKRIQDLQAELASIDYQLTASRNESERLKRTITEYQVKVDVLPTRESELVELTRDYSTLQAAYSNLLMKREDSVIAANLERRQIGEQFKLLDQASLPEAPYNKLQRAGVMSAGALTGLALGLLAVVLLESRDSSFRTKDEVLGRLNLPVLATIPAMRSDRERQSARRRGWLWDVGGTLVLLAAVTVLVIWRLRS